MYIIYVYINILVYIYIYIVATQCVCARVCTVLTCRDYMYVYIVGFLFALFQQIKIEFPSIITATFFFFIFIRFS